MDFLKFSMSEYNSPDAYKGDLTQLEQKIQKLAKQIKQIEGETTSWYTKNYPNLSFEWTEEEIREEELDSISGETDEWLLRVLAKHLEEANQKANEVRIHFEVLVQKLDCLREARPHLFD